MGPPITNFPVGLIKNRVSPSIISAGITFRMTSLMMASLEIFVGHVWFMLGGYHNGVHPVGLAVLILNCDLGFTIGS